MFELPKRVVTVDAVIFNGRGQLLLIERGCDPYEGQLALPGGIVEDNETVEQAVVRELQEETGAIWPAGTLLRLVGAYSAPGRDPRGPTISLAFTALVDDTVHLRAGDDAATVGWYGDWNKRPLAFDHNLIALQAFTQLRLPSAHILVDRGPLRIRKEAEAHSEALNYELDSMGRIKLTRNQRIMLQRLYQGLGALTPADDPTMNALNKKGMVAYTEWEDLIKGEHSAYWVITELGRKAISA